MAEKSAALVELLEPDTDEVLYALLAGSCEPQTFRRTDTNVTGEVFLRRMGVQQAAENKLLERQWSPAERDARRAARAALLAREKAERDARRERIEREQRARSELEAQRRKRAAEQRAFWSAERARQPADRWPAGRGGRPEPPDPPGKPNPQTVLWASRLRHAAAALDRHGAPALADMLRADAARLDAGIPLPSSLCWRLSGYEPADVVDLLEMAMSEAPREPRLNLSVPRFGV